MTESTPAVVGIDVGAQRKGFHVVALDGRRLQAEHFEHPAEAAAWCLRQQATVVAVDAPCRWSLNSGSRKAENELSIGKDTIQCFKTPTRDRAEANTKNFYGWVFNGQSLYKALTPGFPIYEGKPQKNPATIETFPHAVVCALKGSVVPAKPKAATRREVLRQQLPGVDLSPLRNIDFVDAALCALAARAYLENSYQEFGDASEGYIIIPATRKPGKACGD